MDIYNFDSYRKFLQSWIKFRPKRGHGELRKIALALNTSSTIISQVMKGDRNFTMEQAYDLSSYLQLTSTETDYFIKLVLKERAGSKRLENYFQSDLNKLKKKSQNLKNRLPHKKLLNEDEKSIFYSHWLYSAIRTLTATQINTPEKIAEHLDIPRDKIIDVVEFLIRTGLCTPNKDNTLSTSVKRTHIERESLLASRHHINWRQKAIEKMDNINNLEELNFTFPVSLSKNTIKTIHNELINFISTINQLVSDSPSEECACLNIDWFKY